ncbi:hypothetical protein [Pararhizobium sp. DWP3-4]|uniref:hypothetical protein n=1 Tax=unclassified Pararhizobium TaxID=2643050 RepID=UPI003CF464DB
MRNYASFALFAFAVSAFPVHSQTRLPYDKAPYDDTVIQCGALFAIIAKAYADMAQAEKSKPYKEKFDRLSKRSEDEFVSVGRSKQEAQEVYKERVNQLLALLERDEDFTLRHIRFCDQKYPA